MILSTGGHAWLLGGVWLPRGACIVAEEGHAWLLGGMCGCQGCVVAGGHACLPGGMRGCQGACMVAGGGHVWLRGACIVGGMCVHGIRRDTVNERAVRILLECILVTFSYSGKQNIQTRSRFFNFQWEAYYALNSLQIFIAVVQGVVAIIASVMACRPLCCYGNKVGINKLR